MIAFLSNLFRNRGSFISAFKNSFYGDRMFYGVVFRNTQNIYISPHSNIEDGSWILASDPTDTSYKNIIIENNCWIGRHVEIQTNFNSRIEIKEFASVQDRCKILGNVSIGKYCILAPDIFMSSGNHDYKTTPYLTVREQDKAHADASGFNNIDQPIRIEEDCWIGKNVFIKQGVYIGRGAIIGTNSIVNKDLLPYSVNAGVPAQKVKDRLEFSPPHEISAFKPEHHPYFYRGFEHYSRTKSTAELIKDHQGLASEKASLALLEKSVRTQITINGFSKAAAELKVYVDGLLYASSHLSASEPFEIALTSAISDLLLEEYLALPATIKKYRCIQFVVGDEQQKYDFAISKITAS